MHLVQMTEFGGPERLQIVEADDLSPGPGQVVVDVEAAGINFLDVTQRSGASAVHRIALPFVPGLEGVGRVRALGAGVDETPGLKVGARVGWMDVPGSYASQVVAPAARLFAVPETLGASEGLLFQALTAHYLVHEYRDIRPGDRVLVHAAAGGLGQILVQWLKHLGAWVVGTVSSADKAATVRARGADEVVIYADSYEFADEVLSLTGGKGLDLAFDGLGEKTLLQSLSTLARGGTVVAIGAASGPVPPLAPTLLTPRALRLAGGNVFAYVADPAELRRRAADVIGAQQAGWLRLDRATAYPLAQAADAHRDIAERRAQGKLFLRP